MYIGVVQDRPLKVADILATIVQDCFLKIQPVFQHSEKPFRYVSNGFNISFDLSDLLTRVFSS